MSLELEFTSGEQYRNSRFDFAIVFILLINASFTCRAFHTGVAVLFDCLAFLLAVTIRAQ